MENQETKGGELGCCAKGKCCGGKGLAALALLLIGGLGGYAAATHCCKTPSAQAAAPGK